LTGLVAGIAATLTVTQIPASAQAAEQLSTVNATVGCTWVISELPLPAGWSAGYVYNSDRRDSFAGYGVDADGRTRPLVWHDGDVTVLEAPGGVDAVAQDVNSHGDVVGVIQDENTPTHGILWRGGQVIDLPLLPGGSFAVPTAINDAGLIVGYAAGAEASHAVVWSKQSPQTIRDLGVMTGSAYLTDVTDKGTVVGWSDSAGEDFREQAIAGTVRKGLTTLAGPLPGTNSVARAAAGSYIVGSAALTDASEDPPGAVIWTPTGPHALPGTNAAANAVNDYGTVTGFDAALGPVIWVGDDEQPLPALTAGNPFSTSASVVTNNNTAAGVSADGQGHSRPVTWSCTS
jgi:probable HAF family extracellular repeat protein